MPEEKNTAKVGAEPTNTDLDTAKVGAEPTNKDAITDSSTDAKPVPFDKDPRWQSARQAEKKLNDLLKANELDDPDDLLELVEKGKAVKGKLSDLNKLDEIIDKSQKLEKYEAFWKDQEERKRRETEGPEETIARLEHELKRKTAEEQSREHQRKQVEQAERAIASFEKTVEKSVVDLGIPKEQQKFVLEFLGVNNAANDIDITDMKAVKRIIEEGIKKKEAYDQAIIKAYIDGKTEIPKVGSSAATNPVETKPKITMKTARNLFKENMEKWANGG